MDQTDRERIAELEAESARALARLRDLDHRIKNDLQLISSIFVLQLRHARGDPEREMLRGVLARVGAVSAVHRRLDALDDPRDFEASALVRDLVEDATAAVPRDRVQVELDLAPVEVPTRQAAPLALIVGELVRNSLKHGFGDRPGRLQVAFGPADGAVRLSVLDDGIGPPGDQSPPRGFGATLVGLLAQQLRGHAEFTPGDPGLAAVVRFPKGD